VTAGGQPPHGERTGPLRLGEAELQGSSLAGNGTGPLRLGEAELQGRRLQGSGTGPLRLGEAVLQGSSLAGNGTGPLRLGEAELQGRRLQGNGRGHSASERWSCRAAASRGTDGATPPGRGGAAGRAPRGERTGPLRLGEVELQGRRLAGNGRGHSASERRCCRAAASRGAGRGHSASERRCWCASERTESAR